jgi:hypothetical protein
LDSTNPGPGLLYPKANSRNYEMSNASTNKQEKSKEKIPRQKRHDLGKLTTALAEVTTAIAEAAGVPVDEVNLHRLGSSIAKATADISSATGVPAHRLKLSVAFAGDKVAKREAA